VGEEEGEPPAAADASNVHSFNFSLDDDDDDDGDDDIVVVWYQLGRRRDKLTT
jgi:hypothetical protein